MKTIFAIVLSMGWLVCSTGFGQNNSGQKDEPDDATAGALNGDKAAPARQKKTRQTKAKAAAQILRFKIEEGLIYAGEIDEIDDGGKLVAVQQSSHDRGPMAQALLEGLYLALVTDGPPSGNAPPAGSRVLLADVTDVGEAGRLEIQVAAQAFDALEAEQYIFLIRPRGSTTAQMKGIPSIALLESGENAGESAEDATSLAKSINNLKQIGLAMHNFHDVHNFFPPATIYGPDGKPWHSWRVLLLPYLEQAALYERYRWDEPWNGPNNKKLHDEVPSVYRDPVHGESDDAYTHYAVITGEDTCFPAEGPRMEEGSEPLAGLQGWPGRVGLARITDGTSNTLLAGSIAPERKIHWMQPEDIVISETPSIGKRDGFAAPYTTAKGRAGVFLFGDGAVTPILDSIGSETLSKLLRTSDGQVIIDQEIPTLGGGRYAPPTRPEIQIENKAGSVAVRWVMVPYDGSEGAIAPTDAPATEKTTIERAPVRDEPTKAAPPQ